MLRWLTAGESHGPALVATIDGLPAGVAVTSADIATALARRRLGYGRGARQKFEQDEVEILGGVRLGRTLGSPVAVRIGNSEWPKWRTVMSPDPVPASEYAAADDVGAEKELARNRPLTRPRPGHADLVGMQKYGFDDARPVLERASARETAARVALGAVASRFLEQAYGIRLVSHTVAIGAAGTPDDAAIPSAGDVAALDADPVRAFDPAASAAMVAEVDAAHKDGDTLGGVVEVVADGLPPGLGSHVHWDRRLDSRLAAALMGIQAIKGVEVGDGFRTAARRGSQAHDEMTRDGSGVIRRRTGRIRRHRGRDVRRGRAAGAGRDEADQHGAAGAGDRRRRLRGAGARHPPALRRVRRAGRRGGRRGDGGARPRRGVPGEVRRRLGGRDRPQPPGLPRRRARVDADVGGLMPRVVLVGPPGSGKTSTGAVLAERLGVALHDTDAAVEAAEGRSISDIFVVDGEAAFRELERAEVARALAEEPGVVALGGGAPVDPLTEPLLAGHTVVFLDVGIADAAKRIGFDRSRPLLAVNPRASWVRLMNERRPVYERVATHVVDTAGRTPDEVAEEVLGLLGGSP